MYYIGVKVAFCFSVLKRIVPRKAKLAPEFIGIYPPLRA
jgi:hypothetical protein